MSKSRPPLFRLHELPPGQLADFFGLLSERNRGATREGKPFYTCRFRDSRRTVSLMVWADSPWFEACDREWQPGQFYKIRAIYGEHERYGPQIDLNNIRAVTDADKADGFNPADFAECSRFNPETMFAELTGLARDNIADPPLQRLVLTLLERHEAAIKLLPATPRHFHPFAGGWLEHVLSVTRSCILLVDKYRSHYPDLKPPLNRDLVVAGAILHDIGRVLELDGNCLRPEPTVPGRLFGHLMLGRDLVRDAAKELGDVDAELVQLLEHIVLTHLSIPEWGSPRLPLVPECLIIHHADDLDAKIEMYARCLSRDQEPGPFTGRDPILGRKLFKGRKA